MGGGREKGRGREEERGTEREMVGEEGEKEGERRRERDCTPTPSCSAGQPSMACAWKLCQPAPQSLPSPGVPLCSHCAIIAYRSTSSDPFVSSLEAPFQSGSLKRPGTSRQLPNDLRLLQSPISSGFNPEGIYV